MERTTAKVFVSGRSQAVRIPKKFRFKTDEVFIGREGDNIILTPKLKSWGQYFAKRKRFSTDFPDNIENLMPEERKVL